MNSGAELQTRSGLIRPGLIVGGTLVASWALLRTGLPLALRAPLAVLLLLLSVRAWRGSGDCQIGLRPDGTVSLNGRTGVLEVEYTMPFFLAFAVRAVDGTRTRCALFFDQLERDDFRRLLARLREG